MCAVHGARCDLSDPSPPPPSPHRPTLFSLPTLTLPPNPLFTAHPHLTAQPSSHRPPSPHLTAILSSPPALTSPHRHPLLATCPHRPVDRRALRLGSSVPSECVLLHAGEFVECAPPHRARSSRHTPQCTCAHTKPHAHSSSHHTWCVLAHGWQVRAGQGGASSTWRRGRRVGVRNLGLATHV